MLWVKFAKIKRQGQINSGDNIFTKKSYWSHRTMLLRWLMKHHIRSLNLVDFVKGIRLLFTIYRRHSTKSISNSLNAPNIWSNIRLKLNFLNFWFNNFATQHNTYFDTWNASDVLESSSQKTNLPERFQTTVFNSFTNNIHELLQ